jgi:hypothetical protein
MFRTMAAAIVLLPLSAAALAQGTIQQQELPPLPASPQPPPSTSPSQERLLYRQSDPNAAGPAPETAVALPPAVAPDTGRVFCDQSVSFSIAPPDSVPEPYRPFIGIFSDASWTPQLCAALIVQNVQPDGTAAIVYAYGPMGTNVRGAAGGVLNGTGIVRDGELRFQNSDGSQFAFKPLYSDLDGRLTTPKGQSYEAVFKRTF